MIPYESVKNKDGLTCARFNPILNVFTNEIKSDCVDTCKNKSMYELANERRLQAMKFVIGLK